MKMCTNPQGAQSQALHSMQVAALDKASSKIGPALGAPFEKW